VVQLKSGQEGEVLTVARGADALRGKGEVEILLLAATMQAEFGVNWPALYYEATVMVHTPSSPLVTATPRDVVSVKDPD
jgi:hypothetical protein